MKRFGFGAMRLPMVNGEVDKEQFNAMIDEFLAAGFTYFDTAHGYLDGKSETAIRDCLAARYPRESFVLANKLSAGFLRRVRTCCRSLKSSCAAAASTTSTTTSFTP